MLEPHYKTPGNHLVKHGVKKIVVNIRLRCFFEGERKQAKERLEKINIL